LHLPRATFEGSGDGAPPGGESRDAPAGAAATGGGAEGSPLRERREPEPPLCPRERWRLPVVVMPGRALSPRPAPRGSGTRIRASPPAASPTCTRVLVTGEPPAESTQAALHLASAAHNASAHALADVEDSLPWTTKHQTWSGWRSSASWPRPAHDA